jgi:hypothetical protein
LSLTMFLWAYPPFTHVTFLLFTSTVTFLLNKSLNVSDLSEVVDNSPGSGVYALY